MLNTIVADVLAEIADELEKATDVPAAAQKLLQRIATQHKRIVFNGDNYSPDWVTEAEKRGLPNIASTATALRTITEPEHVALFEKHRVLTGTELHARAEIMTEAYTMAIQIEARTMLRMARRQILPASCHYLGRLAQCGASLEKVGRGPTAFGAILDEMSALIDGLHKAWEELQKTVEKNQMITGAADQADHCRAALIPAMEQVRLYADALEGVVDAELWPLPTYPEMLFVR